jgi:low temperature requirement protein LtrA
MVFMTATLSKSMHQRNLTVIGLCVVEAALIVISGLIHLHLQQTAYQHVKTLGPLFIVQFVSCLVVAAGLLVTRHILVALAGVALMAGTIVGFILARTIGIFNFKLPYSTTLANQVLVIEAAAVLVGLLTAWAMWHRRLD